MWFPRVESPEDIVCAALPAELAAGEVFALLHDPSAVEWQERVGVVGAKDGSAKATTRLLSVGDWVLKTDVAQAAEREAVLEAMRAQAERARSLGIWHPSKHWFAMRAGEAWLPLTVCRRLVTLRETPSAGARLAHVARMIAVGAGVSRTHAIGLDLNPSNFAREPGEDHLYYLDDEVYGPLSGRDLGACAASRIPEEPRADDATWRTFGRKVAEAVIEGGSSHDDLGGLLSGANRYPLTPAFDASRRALVEGVRSATWRAQPKARTLLFADVHANLPALQATLARARELGADSYIFLGDAIGYGPHPSEVLEILADLPSALLIQGNHDYAVATGDTDGMNRLATECIQWTQSMVSREEREWLCSLPTEHAEGSWSALHGAPIDPRRFNAYVYEMTYQDNLAAVQEAEKTVCFFGHTHVPNVYRRTGTRDEKILRPSRTQIVPGSHHLINPGSVGQPRDGNSTASFAIWDHQAAEVTFHRVGYPLDITISALKKAGLPADLGYRLELGR